MKGLEADFRKKDDLLSSQDNTHRFYVGGFGHFKKGTALAFGCTQDWSAVKISDDEATTAMEEDSEIRTKRMRFSLRNMQSLHLMSNLLLQVVIRVAIRLSALWMARLFFHQLTRKPLDFSFSVILFLS